MAIANEDALKKSLAAGKLQSVYLLFGEDAYLKTAYLNKISHLIAEPDDVFNYSKFTGKLDLQSVYDAVMQLPFMADRKCVIINDYDFKDVSDKEFERLLSLLGDIPEETTLIMYFDGIAVDTKQARFKKLVIATEKSGGFAVEFKHRSAAELVKMLCDGAAKRHCKMDRVVGSYLVETVGEDINLLRNELEKLCAYVGQGAVTKEHIDLICTKTVEANLFQLSDFILNCDSTNALKLLDELLFMHIEPMPVLYTISGVFVDIYRVSCARLQGKTNDDVIKSFKYPANKHFLVRKAAQNLNKFDVKKITLCLDALVRADKDLKSFGLDSRTVLEQLIIKLIYIIAKGESID